MPKPLYVTGRERWLAVKNSKSFKLMRHLFVRTALLKTLLLMEEGEHYTVDLRAIGINSIDLILDLQDLIEVKIHSHGRKTFRLSKKGLALQKYLQGMLALLEEHDGNNKA